MQVGKAFPYASSKESATLSSGHIPQRPENSFLYIVIYVWIIVKFTYKNGVIFGLAMWRAAQQFRSGGGGAAGTEE